MFEYADDPAPRSAVPQGEWSHNAQYLYSVLWSAFLDLDAYTASRALKRFRPYSTVWVARQMLGLNKDPRGDRGRPLRLTAPFEALAIWVMAPRLFGEPGSQSYGTGRTLTPTLEDELLREGMRKQFEKHFCVPVAYRRGDVDAQSPLPSIPELGIGPATIDVAAGRGSATATIRSLVQVPYERLREIVDPGTWDVCPHFVMGEMEGSDRRRMMLRLPGGAWYDSKAKLRKMRLEYEAVCGSFESRIDYAATEIDAAHSMPSGDEQILTQEVEQSTTGEDQYRPEALHVGTLRGFLSVEKTKGRPGWSSVVGERTVSFESPNHDRFKVETLMLWHAIELMSFVLARRETSGEVR